MTNNQTPMTKQTDNDQQSNGQQLKNAILHDTSGSVIPAKAGIQENLCRCRKCSDRNIEKVPCETAKLSPAKSFLTDGLSWIPAFAGMTGTRVGKRHGACMSQTIRYQVSSLDSNNLFHRLSSSLVIEIG
jgi:hypothetical protein